MPDDWQIDDGHDSEAPIALPPWTFVGVAILVVACMMLLTVIVMVVWMIWSRI